MFRPNDVDMMARLYGAAEATKVYERCCAVDPWFGEYVKQVIYGQIWALPPLTLMEKSLATIVALSVLSKEEQVQIHMFGFLHLGGSRDDLLTLFSKMKMDRYIQSDQFLIDLLKKIETPENKPKQVSKDFLSEKNTAIIKLSAYVVIGDNSKTKEYLLELLSNNLLSEEEIAGVLRHVMTYAGCPCTMNGFAMLLAAKEERCASPAIRRSRL